ncbi:MAG: dephospho-CoA kinase [Rikenellaceae bacterium]|nr:dephospho-CoA kinase [Rikenellaceae bacterium]
MLRIGLTGGIGSGKSTIARIFRALGIPVYDSDSRAKSLMHGAELRERIAALFGPESYSGGQLNTAYIASLVFADRQLLGRLNGIVHPAVMRDFGLWAARKERAGYAYVVQENAILFDHGFDRDMDFTVTVSAPAQERIARASQRDGLKTEEIGRRIANQMTDALRESRADYVISNGERELIVPAVAALHLEFCRLGTCDGKK